MLSHRGPWTGYYDHSHIFRVIPNFLVQFGISYNAEIKHQKTIPDDPPKETRHIPSILASYPSLAMGRTAVHLSSLLRTEPVRALGANLGRRHWVG
jgi:cyclophilin family peptidyl-prolyl cis-trans isomerase